MITFQVEPWSSFKTEAASLWPKHWEEVAINKDKIKLNVDFRQFDAIDSVGQLIVVVGREDGEVVGYWVGFVRPHLHYADSLTAYTDVYFVDPAYRRPRVAWRLFKAVEKELKRRGVQKVFTATKLHLDHSRLFASLGYTETERLFTKMLED